MASFVKMFRSDWFINMWRSVPGSRIIVPDHRDIDMCQGDLNLKFVMNWYY